MKEKVMNDEILIELGVASEETKGLPIVNNESEANPDKQA
jgi:hypothetical protein